jgi:hypothetical protein
MTSITRNESNLSSQVAGARHDPMGIAEGFANFVTVGGDLAVAVDATFDDAATRKAGFSHDGFERVFANAGALGSLELRYTGSSRAHERAPLVDHYSGTLRLPPGTTRRDVEQRGVTFTYALRKGDVFEEKLTRIGG